MEDLIVKYEKYVNEHIEEGFWKSYIEIEEITGIEIHDVIRYIDDSNEFIINTSRKWTTRKMYSKHTKFWKKIIDVYTHLYN